MRLARLHPAILALCVVLGGLAIGKTAQAAGWVSPTGHSDPENKWTNESKAYDGSTSTYASDTSNRTGYGAWINFTLTTPILCDRVRVNADFGYGVVDKVDIDVLRDGQWVDVWEGAVADVQYTEKTFTAGTVSEARFRFHYVATGYYFWLYEFGLWEAPAVINPPTVSTEDPSSIEASTAVFHGKILDDGGSPCEVRFEYGPDTDFGNQTPWVGSHISGDTFGTVITGLGSGTVFYRVQARNGEGTIVSGDDKSFATGTPQGADWRSPTAHTDSTGTWENAENAYDDETGTCARAYHAIGAGQWSQYLYLTRDALPNARGVRFMAKKDSIIDQISIDVLRNGVWTYVYAGTFSNMVWTTKGLSAGSVTQARVRFKVNSTSSGLYWELYEFDFTENPDLVPQAQSGDRYWVASSSGNWSSTANWSTSSGGAGGASVPNSTYLIHFDGNGLGDCTIDANASAMGIDITPGYTGTISQGAGKTMTVGTLGFGQYGGTFAGGDSLIDCNGNFIVGGGTFTSTTGELRTAMNVTVSGTFAHNNGTVVLDGGSKTVSTGSAQFNNVVLNSPGGVTVDGTMNIVNLTNTASNSQSTGVFAVSGNLVTTAQSLSSASATVLLNGSGNQTASANGGSGKICRIVVDKPSGVATFLDNLKVVNGFSQLSGTVDASQGTITIADASAVIDTFDMTFGNLVFDTSGSVNISGTARAVNFSNLRSNSITGTLEVSGNVLTTSQSFSGAPGTLVLNGSGDQTISANGGSGKLPSIVIDKSAFGGSVNLQDTLKIVGGWDFQFADGVNAGTSTVEFCGGSASLYGPSMAFASLVLNTQGNLTLDSDLSTTHLQILGANALNGEAIKVSGDVLTIASTMSGASATVRLVGSGTQNVGAGGGAGKLPNFEVDKPGGTANLSDVLQVNGNWGHISGTVNPGTSTVSFVGISTRSISGAAVFNNLMLNRSFIGETVNVESDVSVQGALDVIKGTLAIVEDHTLSVGGDLSIDLTNGNLLANTSTIAFDGTGAQAVDFGGRGVNNLTVSNAGGTVSFITGVVAAEGSTATFLPGSSLKFANAQVFAFDLIDWKGAAGNPVTLRSDATGMPWFLEAAGYPSATYVDVQDSDASGGETIIATNSNDNGGNSNWAFQGAGLLSITTAATSATNPAWVEGTSGSDAVSLQIAVDEGDPFDAVRLNPTKWFGDDASAGGASLGITVSATQATHVEITATDALSNVNSVSQDITWAETDLTGKYFSTDTVKIRKGDSLLLTADGTGTALEIDGDGDGTFESSGAPGDAFPTLYATAGTYVARAKIDGAEVGSLTVVVIGVDLHGPVACELNWQRIQDTFVMPVSEVASVAFESANPFALTASFNQNTATGVRLNLKPLKMGTPQFLARLGSGGPIFGTQEVKVFILKNLNTAIAGVAMDETGFGEGAFRFQVVPPTVIANDDPGTPETEGLFFDFLVTGGFLTVKENGQSSIRVPSTAQDENGLFEIEVLYDPSGTSVCSRIHAVQVNSPDVDAGPEHHANPCITKVCKVVWFQEEVNDETSAADKARQQGNINAHSKRFHAHPPFVPQLEDGQDHTVMWSQGRQFVFVGEPVGSDYFAALISPPKRGPVEYDVMARCEHEHCPRVPPCPQMDDDGASSHRMVSLKSNPKDEVRAEIFYPFMVNEQEVGKATPGPTTFPHGTYFLSPPNWVGYNPGPEPHIDDPQICGPVPCPHPIDTCKKPIPCFGCNEYLVKYVNHWGTFDVHIGPNGVCPKTDSPRIKDAITIIRLEAVGPKENEQQSGGFVGDPDGTVFPDLVGVVDQADIVRIDVSGGESAEVVQVTAPNEGTQSVVPANTRKGVIEKNTNSFTFDAVLDPDFEIPEGATLTYSWDFGDGSTAEGQSAFHTYVTPGRYTVKLTLTIQVPGSGTIERKAELHSINIIQEECDPEPLHPGFLEESERKGLPVRILARGPAGATVNVALQVRRRADIGQKGLGRVSLDGYPEDEYKNGFTPATSAATVEGLTQYYSMTIDGQAHFPPEDGSAGVETTSFSDPEMVTWVIFLQGMGANDVPDNVDLVVLGRENRAKCDSSFAIEPTCECVYTPTDWEAFNPEKMIMVNIAHEEIHSAPDAASSDQAFLDPQPGQPGGVGGFGGPPENSTIGGLSDPFTLKNITLDLANSPRNAQITLESNVSAFTQTFILSEVSPGLNYFTDATRSQALFLRSLPSSDPSLVESVDIYFASTTFGKFKPMVLTETGPATDTFESEHPELIIEMSGPPSDLAIDSMEITLTSNIYPNLLNVPLNEELVETAPDSNIFLGTTTTLLAQFHEPLDASSKWGVTAFVTNPILGYESKPINGIEDENLPGFSLTTAALKNQGGPQFNDLDPLPILWGPLIRNPNQATKDLFSPQVPEQKRKAILMYKRGIQDWEKVGPSPLDGQQLDFLRLVKYYDDIVMTKEARKDEFSFQVVTDDETAGVPSTPYWHRVAKPSPAFHLNHWYSGSDENVDGRTIYLGGVLPGDILRLVWDKNADGSYDATTEDIYAELWVISLKILDASKILATHVQIARWDNAYTGGVLRNSPTDCFVDVDPERFYIQVVDPRQNRGPGSVDEIKLQVDIGTQKKDGSQDDDQSYITCVETGPDTGIFESKSQLLTTSDGPTRPDDKVEVYDGFTGLVADDSESDDRTHRATIYGSAVARYEYQNNSRITRELPVCRRIPEERRWVRLRFIIPMEPFRDVGYDDDNNPMTPNVGAGNGIFDWNDANFDGIMDPSEHEEFSDFNNNGIRDKVADESYINEQVEVANRLWAQACIGIRANPEILVSELPFAAGNVQVAINGEITEDQINNIHEFAQIFTEFGLGQQNSITVVLYPDFSINGFPGNAVSLVPAFHAGYPAIFPGGYNEETLVVLRTGFPSSYRTLAHELGHCLTNVPDEARADEYFFPSLSGTSYQIDDELHYRRLEEAAAVAAHTIRPAGNETAVGNRLVEDQE